MQIGLDKDNCRININNSVPGEKYFCPVCKQPLVTKKGQIKIHHFAHAIGYNCKDNWHYEEMSEWHLYWQNLFPEKCREVVMEHDGSIHRADVFVNDVVIEFQHSSMLNTEFDERNMFYNSLGYKVIWVFDFEEESSQKRINQTKTPLVYNWKWAKGTFKNFDPTKENVQVFFQLDSSIRNGREIPNLYKIIWKGKNGIKLFGVDKHIYNDKDFYLEKRNVVPKYLQEDVINDMFNEHRVCQIGTGKIFHGCPLSENGFSSDEMQVNEYGYCPDCKYNASYFKCNYPLYYLEIPEAAVITNIKKDKFGLVFEVSYKLDDETIITKSMPKSNYGAKTIFEIWEESNKNEYLICFDLVSRFYVKLKNPIEKWNKYHHVYGYISDEYVKLFNKLESKEIYNPNDKRWVRVK